MARRNKVQLPVVTIVIAVVLLAIIGVVAAIKTFGGSGTVDAPVTQQQEGAQDTKAPTQTDSSDAATKEEVSDKAASDSTAASIDPATVSTIDVTQMSITVSYVKGLNDGFEYEVLRTPSGTRYVQFSTPVLVGTKCTDDNGTFASIVQSPTADDDTSTIDQKTTVDGTVYGLSLSGENCTGNLELFAQYQKSFSDAFPLLKKME